MLHFSAEELETRRRHSCAALEAQGLDALLMFRQESMYYLTGYDTFGYVFFQCLVLKNDGKMFLLTRAPDLRQARETSCIEDVRVWVDHPEARPELQLREGLAQMGLAGKRLGVELDAYGLTAANGKRLEAGLEGFATLADASRIVSEQRVVKSAAEIAYVRRAGQLADDAQGAAQALVGPGADEGEILAAMQGAVFKGGGDYPGNEFIIGSGSGALLCRYFSGRRKLDADDQLTLEWAGAYRHYHAAMMRTVPIGRMPTRQGDLFEAAQEALLAVEARLRPGATFGEAFDAHAAVMDKAGLQAHRMNACGYSLGATFAPNWMDWPMLYHANPVEMRPGMVIFCHMILFDSDRGLAMSLGRTSLVTESGPDCLSKRPLDLLRA